MFLNPIKLHGLLYIYLLDQSALILVTDCEHYICAASLALGAMQVLPKLEAQAVAKRKKKQVAGGLTFLLQYSNRM